MMPMNVLLAETHEMIRQDLRAVLTQQSGLRIIAEAATGPQVVALAQENSPDITILDLALPDLTAPEVVRQVLSACPQTRIIVISVFADRRFVLTMLKSGAQGYVLKDRAFAELPQAVAQVQENRIYLSAGLPPAILEDYLQEVREREAEYRAVLTTLPCAVFLLDRAGRLVFSNVALELLVGYDQEELRQQDFASLLAPGTGFSPELGLTADPAMTVGPREYRLLRKNGQEVWGRMTLRPFAGQNQGDSLILGLVEDVTLAKQAEDKTRRYQAQLRAMALDLALAAERERKQLAGDLHDRVIQTLALTQIKLGAVSGAAGPGLAEPVEEVRSLVTEAIRAAREVSFDLSSPVLYELGFEAAVEWLIEILGEQRGLHCQLQVEPRLPSLSVSSRVLLFQAVRELLNCVTIPPKGDNIRVSISRENGNLQVRLEYSGTPPATGIVTGGKESWDATLFSVTERLKQLGGYLSVENGPGAGLRVILAVPLMDERTDL